MTSTDQLTRWVGADARPYVAQALAHPDPDPAELPLWDRARALKVLQRECDSFTRIGGGLAAWLLAVAGSVGLGVALWDGLSVPLRVLALVLGLVLLAAGALLGFQVWRAGKAVVDAFRWWTLLPERLPGGGAGVEDWRASPVADAVQARVFVFQGWRPLRYVLAAAAVLSPLAFVQTAVVESPRFDPTWHEGQPAALAVIIVGLAVAGLAAGVVVFGGQYRANRAHAERDPIQRKLLGR